MMSTKHTSPIGANDRLPLGGLLALAMAGFITIMTEVMPAGLLPQISTDLDVSVSLAGQFVTAFAFGALVSAIPFMLVTQAMYRRDLLLSALTGLALVNIVTASSEYYWLTVSARFFAGMCGGLVWALLVGYAARITPSRHIGRGITIMGIGAPLAFSFGVPTGTFLGTVLGWRLSFGFMSVLIIVLIGWVFATLPNFAGQRRHRPFSVAGALALPGLKGILLIMFAFVLAHNILYTYIAPFLASSPLEPRVDLVLLAFGIAGILGTWIVGALIDRHLWRLVVASLLIFSIVALMLGFASSSQIIIFAAVVLWGTIVGGAPPLFQTAGAKAAGDATDIAQAIAVTVWNAGIASGGVIGGLLLEHLGASSFPWAILIVLLPILIITWRMRS